MLDIPYRKIFLIILIIFLLFLYLKEHIKISTIILIIIFLILGNNITQKALEPPEVHNYVGKEIIFSGYVEKIENKGEYFRVYIKGTEKIIVNTKSINCIVGDFVSATCFISTFDRPRNYGEFDSKWYYKAHNIWVKGEGDINVIKPANAYFQGLDKIKNKFLQNIDALATDDTKGILKSILMGDKSELNPEVSESFQENGISHILAISGLHLSIIGLTVYKLLRKIGIKFLLCAIISGFLLVSYGIMTGNSISTLRALIMFIISVNAQVTGRRYDIITSTSLAALLLLLNYPLYITSSGFLLSFGAVLGIVCFTKTISNIFPENTNKIIKKFAMTFFASLGVTIVTIPVIGYFFYQISPYSVALNIVVVPLMTVVMAGGILGGFLAQANILLGKFFIGPSCIVLKLYMYLCECVEKLPNHIIITGCPKVWNIIIYVIFLVVMFLFIKNAKRSYRSIVEFVFLVLISNFVLFLREGNNMAVYMLDVGQGMCMLVENEGTFSMIDCGSSDVNSCVQKRVIPALKYYGVGRLDSLFVTHSDSDHCNGVQKLLDNVSVGNIYCGGNKEYDEKSIRLESGMKLRWNGASIDVYNPIALRTYSDENEASLAFLLKKEDFTMLITGDLDGTMEDFVIKNVTYKGELDVLQVAHHGSKNSSGKNFVEFLKPKIALISCGIKNKYGHPANETISRLEAVKSKIWRTDIYGQITILVDKSGEITEFAFLS